MADIAPTRQEADGWLAAVLAEQLPPSCKLVAARLRLHLNFDTGLLYPSMATLATGCRLSVRAVEMAITRLERAGWIARESAKGRIANRYRLQLAERAAAPITPNKHSGLDTINPEQACGVNPEQAFGVDASNPENRCVQPRKSMRPTPNVRSGEPKKEPRREPKKASTESVAARASEAVIDFRKRLVDAFRDVGSPNIPDTAWAETWLANGYDPELCIAVVRDGISRKPTISTLSYFDKRIAEQHANRASAPNGRPSDARASPREARGSGIGSVIDGIARARVEDDR